ncbi:DMT family transporter [Rubrobacter calidifluminis]|uniref:DMT family transporter n=1 Tax=Rubrobacter calidifluminis TaxID=1392640 RepID=UPI00235E60CC|nr:EamA family transporter [Rubrobacter calidifluminis]
MSKNTGAEERGRAIPGNYPVLLAAVLWGTTGTAGAFAPPSATPEAIGAARVTVGGLALLAVTLWRGTLRGHRWPLLETATGCAGVAAYQVLFFSGVSRTGVAIGTIVAIGSAPIFGGITGFLVRGERLSSRWATATALAVVGCTLLIGAGGGISVDPLGIVLSLGAGASYAAYATASKGLLERIPPEVVMAVIFTGGAVLLSPVLVLSGAGWLLEGRGIGVALHLGLVATAAAYFLFGRGLRLIPVATATTLSLAEPLTAALLGVFVLGEHLTPLELLGGALLFCGLVVLSQRDTAS